MKVFATFSAIVSVFASIASAYTPPVGDPQGNPIYKPGLNEIVPVGKPYTITWDPTTPGTVTIVLMRGPSNNILPLYPIVEKTPNTGTFVWTPSTDLEDDVTHYGLQLIVDSNGQYQWSTQFGISNPGDTKSSSSVTSTVKVTTSSTIVATETSTAVGIKETESTTCEETTATTTTVEETTTTAECSTTETTTTEVSTTISNRTTTSSTYVKPTTSTIIVITPTVHTTLHTTTATFYSNHTTTTTKPSVTTASGPPLQTTNAAERNIISFGMTLIAVAAAGFSLF